MFKAFFNSILMEAKNDDKPTDYSKEDPEKDDKKTDNKKDDKNDKPDARVGNATDKKDETSTDYTVEDDSIGSDDKESTDYSADSPEDDDKADASGEDSEPTDYSADAGDDNTDDEENTDDENAGGDEEEGTDYSADADGSMGDDDSGDDSSEDSAEDSEESGDDDSVPKDDKLRKFYLLKDFRELQEFIKDAADKITEKKRDSFKEKQVDMLVVNNFNKLGDVVGDYMVFKFDEDDYTTALYNYRRFMIAIDLNLELIKKVNEIKQRNQNEKDAKEDKTTGKSKKKSKNKSKKPSDKDSNADTKSSDLTNM